MNVPVLAPSGVAPEFESGPVHFIAAAGGSLLSDCRGYPEPRHQDQCARARASLPVLVVFVKLCKLAVLV